MIFRKIITPAVCCSLLMAITGCIDATSAILVKKDGSGFVVETVYMSKAAADMMVGMMAGLGGQAGNSNPGKMPLEIEKYKAAAARMGEGVKYVSAKEVTKADGSSGVKITYSFDDVRKLKVSQNPDAPSAGGPQMGAQSTETTDGKQITFDFEPGNNPCLVIKMPPMEKDSKADQEATVAAPMPSLDNADAQMAMMKPMLKDMRIRIMVKVEGNITESNASFIAAADSKGDKNVITLLDMNIGKLLEMPEQMQKLQAMGQVKDVAIAKEAFKDIPEFKVETEEVVKIRFK